VFQNLVKKLQAKGVSLFVHSAVFLTTGPQPLPKRVLRRVRSSASSFNFQYPLFSLRLSSSCLRLLPRLTVTSILPSSFSSTKCFRRQFLRKMWPVRLAFVSAVCRTFLSSLTLCNTYSFLTQSVQLIFSILLQYYILNFPRISDLISEVSKFQYHTKICSKRSALPVQMFLKETRYRLCTGYVSLRLGSWQDRNERLSSIMFVQLNEYWLSIKDTFPWNHEVFWRLAFWR